MKNMALHPLELKEWFCELCCCFQGPFLFRLGLRLQSVFSWKGTMIASWVLGMAMGFSGDLLPPHRTQARPYRFQKRTPRHSNKTINETWKTSAQSQPKWDQEVHKQMNPPPAHNYCVFVKLSSKIALFLRYPRRGKKVQLHAFLDLKLVQQKQRKQLHPRRGKKVAILLVPLRYILFGVVLRIYHVFWRRFGSGFEVRIIYFVPEHSPASSFRKMSRAMLQF